MPNTRISMCVTSCNRHDLLKTTLESFYHVVDQEPQELIIYEDSNTPMPEFLNDPIWRQRGLKWLSDGERKGQAYACARLIREAQFEYIFWCEDDWFWQNSISPFMRESRAILDSHSEIIQVSLRGDTGWHPLVKQGDLWIAEPYWRGVWGGWAWNPGLRRRTDCVNILPQITSQIGTGGLQHEEALSKSLLDQGHRIADLNRSVISHIGGCRSRAVETLPPLPKILIAVLTCFEFDYESHEVHIGNKFHENGPNEQTQAVRETWGADVAKFQNVTLRFFYGKPKDGYPREPQADEVFLDCGDGYDSLIQKTTATCKWASENGFRVMFKCDTDTYVFVDRLLIEIMENRFDYAGYLHGGVCSGGPGYLLSDHAMRVITHQGRQPQHSYAEDVHVSRVLGNAGIKPLMLQGHHSGFSAHFFFNEGFTPAKLTDEMVTMHAVFPKEMRECYEYTQHRNELKEAA